MSNQSNGGHMTRARYHKFSFLLLVLILTLDACSAESRSMKSLTINCKYGYYIIVHETDSDGWIKGELYDADGAQVNMPTCWMDYSNEDSDFDDIIILWFAEDNQLGYYDLKYSYFQGPAYDDISYRTRNNQNYIAVSVKNKWGFVRRNNGQISVPIMYDDYEDYENGFALVCISDLKGEPYSDRWMLINGDGVPVRFDPLILPVTVPNQKGLLIVESMEQGYTVYYMATTNGSIMYNEPFLLFSEAFQYYLDP